MSGTLEKFKEEFNEIYEIVKTVEVVTKSRRTIRIEILKSYPKGTRSDDKSYVARYWEKVTTHLQPTYPGGENKLPLSPTDTGILWDIYYAWVDMPNPDMALTQALGFIIGK